jgi:hypothetical protein
MKSETAIRKLLTDCLEISIDKAIHWLKYTALLEVFEWIN